MIWKVITHDHLFVYWNGHLIYKRWMRRNCGMVFDKWGHPFYSDGRPS